MASDAEIREAEQRVIEAARRFCQGDNSTSPMNKALSRLDALKPPLPSQEELCAYPEVKLIPRNKRLPEYWGAYWLRWVQGEMNRRYTASETDHIHPDELADWADELEARE